MSRAGRVLYAGVLLLFGVLVLAALWLGLWLHAILAAVFGIVFMVVGWFVLSRAWRPPPRGRRRPVRRRR